MMREVIKNDKEMEAIIVSSVVTIILFIIMAIVGGLSSVVMLLSLPVLLVWKIGRKIKYGYSLYD